MSPMLLERGTWTLDLVVVFFSIMDMFTDSAVQPIISSVPAFLVCNSGQPTV